MKKTLIASALLAATGLAGNAMAAPIGDGTLTFINNSAVVPANTFSLSSGVYVGGNFIPTGAPNNTNFGVNPQGAAAEFRMIGTDGAVGGGGEKSIVGLVRDDGTAPDNGTDFINWTTSGAYGGVVVGADGDLTPGAANSSLGQVTGGMTNAVFFGQFFGFAIDPANFVFVDVDTGAGTISIDTAGMEAQWGNQYFPMGYTGGGANQCNTDGQGCGIHLAGTISNIVGNDFDFTLFGEHRITPWEDTEGGTLGTGAGFAGWVAQFGLTGHFTAAPSAIPVPAAVWLFGSGLLGLVGVARRKKA